ncbi:hypothetical protein ACRWQL_01045 [Shewanella sp. HL-SH4]|uniref:hypothetical protein n=1 Tax=Shewanella sp. HL-SH4 TaxID=3436240 RepID=UPI003EC0FAEE
MQATNLLSRFWLTDRFGNVCQSRPVNNNDIVFKREKTPLLPCFRDKSISFAERLGQVGFDHLAFSVPFRSFQRLDCSAWAKLPDYSTYPDTQDGLDLFHEHVKETEQLRVEEFVIRVLGLRLGSTRSYGRFFYTHSKEILDAKRKKLLVLSRSVAITILFTFKYLALVANIYLVIQMVIGFTTGLSLWALLI